MMTPDEMRRAAELLHREGVMQRMTHSQDRAREFQALAAKLRAMAEADADSGWQPIETAPREHGERVLLADGIDVGEGYWYEDVNEPLGGWWVSFEYGMYELQPPTHWQPLPPPPHCST